MSQVAFCAVGEFADHSLEKARYKSSQQRRRFSVTFKQESEADSDPLLALCRYLASGLCSPLLATSHSTPPRRRPPLPQTRVQVSSLLRLSFSSELTHRSGSATDGILGGYTTSGGNPYTEWASNSGGVGTTLTLTWATPQTVNMVVLYDR